MSTLARSGSTYVKSNTMNTFRPILLLALLTISAFAQKAVTVNNTTNDVNGPIHNITIAGVLTCCSTLSLANNSISFYSFGAVNAPFPGSVLTVLGNYTANWQLPIGTGGSVTSFGASVPSFLNATVSNSTTTPFLNITYGAVPLPVANGGTGLTALPSPTLNITGDATGNTTFTNLGNGTLSLVLANTTVTAATYGSSTTWPTVTIDSKGRVTAATNQALPSPTLTATGDATGSTTFTNLGNGSLGLTLASTPVSAGSYGNVTAWSTFTVDAKGRLTAAGGQALPSPTLSITGDATGNTTFTNLANGSLSLTLSNTSVVAGTYGNSTTVPQFVVNSKGQVTSVTNTGISLTGATTSILAGNGSNGFANVTVTGGLLYTASNNTLQSMSSTLYMPIAGGTFTGNVAMTNFSASGNATLTSLSVSGNATIGNVTINGTFNLSNIVASGNSLINGNSTVIGNYQVIGNTTLTNVSASGTVTFSSLISAGVVINAAGGQLSTTTTPSFSAVNITTGTLPISAINATGTPSSSTFLRGDGSWSTVSTTGATTSILAGNGSGGYSNVVVGSGLSYAPGNSTLSVTVSPHAVILYTTNQTLSAVNNTIFMFNGSSLYVTLPSAASMFNTTISSTTTITIKNLNASALTIVPNGSSTIDGAGGNFTLANNGVNNGNSIDIFSDGTNYWLK